MHSTQAVGAASARRHPIALTHSLTVEGHAQAVGSCTIAAHQQLGSIPGEGEACLGGLRWGPAEGPAVVRGGDTPTERGKERWQQQRVRDECGGNMVSRQPSG